MKEKLPLEDKYQSKNLFYNVEISRRGYRIFCNRQYRAKTMVNKIEWEAEYLKILAPQEARHSCRAEKGRLNGVR
jgi:hypothetical protein